MFTLCAAIKSHNAIVNRKFNSLIVASLKVEELVFVHTAPISAINSMLVANKKCSSNNIVLFLIKWLINFVSTNQYDIVFHCRAKRVKKLCRQITAMAAAF